MTNAFKRVTIRCAGGALFVCALSLPARGEASSLGWEECVREARKNHPDLVSAREKVRQAKASTEIARSVAMPQVSGGASETTTKSPAPVNSDGVSIGKSSKSVKYQYEVTGEQLLFDGFKAASDLSEAEKNVESERYDYDVTSSNVRLRLRTAFIELLNAQELLNVTGEIEMRRKQNVELVKLRYEGGREHRGSLLTSEADLAQASYEVVQAKRNIYASQRRLIKELGRSAFSPLEATGTFEVKDLQREMPDLDELAKTTPLLRQLIVKKEAARYGVHSAYADFFPQIYASGSLGNSSSRWFPDKNEWSAGARVSVPIFDGGNRFAALSKAKSALGQAQADERSGRDGVVLTLSDAWIGLQDAVDMVAVKRKFLEATKERSEIAESEYSIGLLLFDNWIIIEDDYVSAKKDFLGAETSALIAEANWVQAKGGTLDHE